MDSKISILLLLSLSLTFGQKGKLELNDGNYMVDWNLAEDKTSLFFSVTAESSGWIGMGFSPSGNMVNADMIIGEVDGDELRIRDFWSTKFEKPTADDKQDLSEMKSWRNGTMAHMEFRRKLDTGDTEQDLVIPLSGISVIWAISDEPTLNEKHKERGSTEVTFDGSDSGNSSYRNSSSLLIIFLTFLMVFSKLSGGMK